MALDYWYDGQLRRYWLQFCRIFEGFQYESGIGASGVKTLRTFPVSLAGKDRQVSHILRNNSENTILSTPRVTCEMIDIQMAPERRQTPNHVSTVNVFERAIDPSTNRYTGELGKTYTVERIMAIPYDVTMRTNIWTSTQDQKHQFMEQVMVLFNPSLDIQTGDNPIDWTSLTYVEMDTITWSNREMPIGTDDDIEIATITFKMPIWLSPPAKIKRQNIIHQIITNIGEMNENYVGEQAGGYNFSSSDSHTRLIVTPKNHQSRAEVLIGSNNLPYCEITLLSGHGNLHDDQGKIFDWRALLNTYGQYRKGVTQFRLKTTEDMDDHESDIKGIFDFHPTETNKLVWTPDPVSLPRNTMQSIQGIITLSPTGAEPIGRWPGDGVLAPAELGQRYMLVDDLPSDPRWTDLEASINDIIEYDGTKWFIAFDASITTTHEVVLNTRSNKQLRWTGETWVDAISGDYLPGYWRVFL
jgi:hypothetical protein